MIPAPVDALLQIPGAGFERVGGIALETVTHAAQLVFERGNLATQFLFLAHLSSSLWFPRGVSLAGIAVLFPFGLGRLISTDQAVFEPELV